jgi:class 3 adenylate cyclase
MGIHTGEPVVEEDDYVGIDVHHVARLCSIGHGGQVLLSQATLDALDRGSSGARVEHDRGARGVLDRERSATSSKATAIVASAPRCATRGSLSTASGCAD